jgi:3-oxoadipate enol-lactonase
MTVTLSADVHHRGRERAIVLLHSLALDRSMWEGLIEHLPQDRAVVAPDLRGHGASPSGGSFTIEDMADDVAATVAGLGYDRVTVVGLSMGGCVAQALAVRHPHVVEGLGLIDTTAWYGPDAPAEWEARAAKARENGMASLSQFQLARWFGDDFVREHPQIGERLLRVFAGNNVDSYTASCRAMGAVDLRDAIGELDVPTVIVVGEHDPATPPEHARALHERISGSTLHVMPGTKHLTPIECPAEVAALLAPLLA